MLKVFERGGYLGLRPHHHLVGSGTALDLNLGLLAHLCIYTEVKSACEGDMNMGMVTRPWHGVT